MDSSNGYIPDKDAYELLYDTVIEQNQKEQPFFTTIYTFGTHVTLDSPDEQYGDGTNPALNKFFNTDFQFGIFLERFRESELYDNTLLILTSDHATCADDDFRSTFSDYSRQSFGLDKIPFCIYHKGIEARVIDANGRNSLCIAPTLLDYLDISEPNYFLGTSLFVSDYDESKYSTTFYYPGEILSTVGGEIKELSEEDYLDFWGKLTMYFAATNNDDLMDISAIVSDDCSNLTITFSSEQEYPNIWFYVWSQENGQDDLACYQAVKENNSWTYTVDLGKHGSKGAYYVHVYEGKERPEQILIDTLPYIPNYPPYHLEIETSKDCSKVDIALSNTGNYVNFLFPIWSEANGQDDIVWYQPEKDENGIWRCVIDVADHSDSISSSLVIHVYGKLQEQDEYKFITNSILNFEKDGL